MNRKCNIPLEDCPLFERSGRCFEDTHHEFYPRVDYTTPIAKLFRELPENKNKMRRCEHEELHATQEVPEKPGVRTMKRAIADAVGSGAMYLSVNNQRSLE